MAPRNLKLTHDDGRLYLVPQDSTGPDPELEEINRALERIEQEKSYAVRAQSRAITEVGENIEEQKPDNLGDYLTKIHDIEKEFEENRKKIKKSAFLVLGIDEKGEPTESRLVRLSDILIRTEDMPISEDRTTFKVEIDRTLTVIKQVLKAERNPLQRALDWSPSSFQRMSERRANYVRGLKGICHVGLEHEDASQFKLANKSLESFREEFVANEAGTVKNNYLWRLGLWCLAMSVVASLAYVYARTLPATHPVNYFRTFFMLVAGAGVGTWLSFALRRVILTFLDLAALEEDRLDPFLRVLFITALASIVGLLIWTGAITITVGGFTTTTFPKNGVTALLIGLLLGVAERTLATAVQKRATEFGAGIGGK